jgi:hypothetical protein
MSDEAEDQEVEFYTPEPCILSCPEGDVLIPDPAAFVEHYNALAVQFTAGGLFILRAGSSWLNVEKADQPAGDTVTRFGKRH